MESISRKFWMQCSRWCSLLLCLTYAGTATAAAAIAINVNKRNDFTRTLTQGPNDLGQAPPANDADREAELTAPSGVACTLWLGDVSFILSYIVDLMALCQ
jgi:hypothetical protein